jgi:8-oxo-dGTP pyrophosphatase MutT (NUDIX family)
MGKIRSIVKQNPNSAQELMDRMKSGMDQLASKVIHSRSTEKYTSINVKNGYIEFRSPGGDWLNDNFKEIDNTLRRFTVALSAAVDPEMYRQEYLKKLYKLLDVSSEKDPLSYFAKFAAGELPKAALKSFVRQAQLERGVKRGKETGPMWWRVYKEGKGAANGAIIEVVANTEEAAKRKAAQEWGEPLLVNVLAKMHAEPVRPYDGVDTSREYELYDRRSGSVVATFRASDDDAALAKLDQFRAGQVQTQGITVPEAEAMYGVRSSRAVTVPPRDRQSTEPIPGSTLDLQRQRAAAADQYYNVSYHTASGQTNNVQVRARNADAAMAQVRSDLESSGQRVIRIEADPATNQGPSNTAQIPTIDIDVEPAPAPQQPGMGQWNGQWKVLVGGQEVYRFGGIGNSQADANRIAAAWLRQNGQGVSGEGFEVYPVMDESLREYKMPQPSHGAGKIRDLNKPLGPETPPEMPDGTIKVDVSDMYDWYKLGQKISDLGSIKPGELGQGPPSTVFAFGSEDLENMYSHALTRLGLKTHDLDEPGEEDIDEDTKKQHSRQDAAGIVLYAEDTGRYGLQQRSNTVNDPGIWAAWGGGREPGETLEQCARRELAEEGGYTGPIQLQRLGENSRYVTFLGRVPHEFEPRADDEWQDYCWVEAGDWPAPMHPGTAAALSNLSINENFADGKNPGRKGLSKRVGVNTKASVSDLRKTAKNSSGEKQRMAHWLANMKAGRAKAKRK